VRILDVRPRPSCHACYRGRCFGSNVAASWGFQYHDLIEEPKPREVVTIFELDTSGEPFARAVYNYVWTPQTDPDGIVHASIDYPGVQVDHALVKKRENIMPNVKVPARLHFGTMGLAPAESDYVSSIPPSYSGGNIDDWRVGKGARMYYPVAVEGAFFSVGDPHAAQGDSELGGTAIETSLTGDFELVLHKKSDLDGTSLEGLTHPMLETDDQWSVYGFTFPNYLAELGANAQLEVAQHASLDRAMRDAFRKLRRFLMTVHRLSEDEAIALMSVAADFGVTQVVDGNWGVHGSIRKNVFA
jgi:acetamidase/formamidase